MNRAEKRRQRKLAGAAAANRSPTQQSQPSQQTLTLAVQLHNAGRLSEAEAMYQQVLQAEPAHFDALHLLGVLANQVGKNDIAVDLITKALAIKPDFAEAHYNLGNALKSLGRLAESISSYQKALGIKPDFVEAHFNHGNALKLSGAMDQAAACYIKAIDAKPDYAEAHSNLGSVFKELGKLDKAVASCERALAIKPDFAETHNILGTVHMELRELDKAAAHFLEATKIKPDYAEAYSNLGVTLKELGKLEESVANCRRALAIDPSSAQAHHNLGNAQMDLGELDDAVTSYLTAIEIEPDFALAQCNYAISLKNQGKLFEACQVLQVALEKNPENILLSDYLIRFLNYFMPDTDVPSVHAKAQKALQLMAMPYAKTSHIADEEVAQFYQQCHDVLASHNLSGKTSLSQIFRGTTGPRDCDRHMKVFDAFNTIPEFCFGCYKVVAEPQTVVDLIKLWIVFADIELPSDNIWKCHIELRNKILGAYKCTVYCQDLDEAREISKIVQKAVDEKITNSTSVSVKRGCSEYPLSHPAYGLIDDNVNVMDLYTDQWRENEIYTDNNLVKHNYPSEYDTFNHSGITLRDASVMHTWVSYAATIGDLSYMVMTGGVSVQKMANVKRAPFQPLIDK